MKNTNRWAFDVEVFPNFFCCTFITVDKSEIKTFIIFKNRDDRVGLFNFLKTNPFLISFNGISYDMPIIRYIEQYKGNSITEDIYRISSKLVSDIYKDDPEIRKLRYPFEKKWEHQDLMSMMGFLRTGVGLKQCSINLKWKLVQDLPFEYSYSVVPEDVSVIVEYNKNDVFITIELYNDKEVSKARELRESLVEEFGIGILSAADSQMANTILESLYEKEIGISKKIFKEQRTPRYKIKLSDVIFDSIKFNTLELSDFLERLKSTIVHDYNSYKFDESIYFHNNKYNFGVGGLHTDEYPNYFRASSEIKIMSADVASFYPSIMCEYGVKPEHASDKFLQILSAVKKERLEAKRTGNKIKADSYKILINSIFGKLGFNSYWLYDPFAMLRVTLNGQLFLMMLIEKLEQAEIRVISANTDGVECLLPKEKESVFTEITKEWQKTNNFELEFALYDKYVKRDVNNYIAVFDDGHSKEKGVFTRTVELKKSYHMPIVAKCLYSYFINNTPIRQTLEECTDIFEFCLSQKSGGDFKIELHNNSGIEKLQKTNRFFISKKGGRLIKRQQFTGKTTGLYVGSLVTILNNYDANKPFSEYDVDISFYEKEAMKIVDAVEPKQLSMFDMATIDRGTKTKMAVPESSFVKEEPITVNELNKLGSKQFSKRIETIVKNELTIDKISPRYAFIVDMEHKEMKISLYCLRKGTLQTFSIDKRAFNKLSLVSGQLVFCDKFEKKTNGYVLTAYHLVNNFEIEEPSLNMRTK